MYVSSKIYPLICRRCGRGSKRNSEDQHKEIWQVKCQRTGRRRHRVVSSGRCVAPPWPCSTACLQRLTGTKPVSLWSWSVNEREDDQIDVSSPDQLVNDRMTERLDSEGRIVSTSPLTEPSCMAEFTSSVTC